MDAIVTAGGIPEPGDPLYEYTQGEAKAMLELAGKPMAQWVLDALSDAEQIERVVVIGLSEENGLACSKPITYLPNQGGMLQNIVAGTQKLLEFDARHRLALIVSSDIPAITATIVDWMVRETSKTDHQIYYNVIQREVMEKRFPGSKRSYTKFKDVEVCGGDMTAFNTEMAAEEGGLWQELIAARKNVFKQAALLGFDTLLLLLLRRLTLQDAVERASRSLNVTARAIICPYPEIGMDVDKPYQLAILRKELAQRTEA